jgi:hypothetical protein
VGDPKFQGKYKSLVDDLKSLDNDVFLRKYMFVLYEGNVLFDQADLLYEKGILYLTNTDCTKLYSMYILKSPNTSNLRTSI